MSDTTNLRWDKINLLGIDVGYSKKRASTGIATYVSGRLELFYVGSQAKDREAVLSKFAKFSFAAIDGPLIPEQSLNKKDKRLCEYSFIGGNLEKRCKAGLSHCGSAIEFRSAAQIIADDVKDRLNNDQFNFVGPFVRENSPIVEAFPNGFIGTLLDTAHYENMPRLKRGRKFDELYDRAINAKIFNKIMRHLKWDDDNLISILNTETHHEKRAALICILTAACAAARKTKFVGDKSGGFV